MNSFGGFFVPAGFVISVSLVIPAAAGIQIKKVDVNGN
jgi:hypothetical protein